MTHFVTPETPNLLRNAVGKCASCKRGMLVAEVGRPKKFCSTKCRMAAHRKAAREMRPNEFYTPAHIVEIARVCMGGIDLDPASCPIANEIVQATTFYDVKQDGLKQPWFGRVWLNPPYGKFSAAFVRRAVAEFEGGRIEQVIILLRLTHLATAWYHDAMRAENLTCIPRTRINFDSVVFGSVSDGANNNGGSALIGIGVPRTRFEAHFGPLGKIAFVPEVKP